MDFFMKKNNIVHVGFDLSNAFPRFICLKKEIYLLTFIRTF